jgi:hypothetical protein
VERWGTKMDASNEAEQGKPGDKVSLVGGPATATARPQSPSPSASKGRASWLGNVAQWGSAIIATLALIVSVVVGYFAVLRQKEELLVEVYQWPKFGLTRDTRHEYVDGRLDVLLINSGNRPIAITSVDLVLSQKATYACGDGSRFKTVMDPFVVKENEIVQKEFVPAIDESLPLDQEQMGPMRVETKQAPAALQKKGWHSYNITLCAVFHATSPSEVGIVGSANGGAEDYYEDGSGGASMEFGDSRPTRIWRKILGVLDK